MGEEKTEELYEMENIDRGEENEIKGSYKLDPRYLLCYNWIE